MNLHCYQIILTKEILLGILMLADHVKYPISCLLGTSSRGVSYQLQFLTATDLQRAVSKGFFLHVITEFILMQSLVKNTL